MRQRRDDLIQLVVGTDFLRPLIYLNNQSQWTLSLGLMGFLGEHSAAWGPLMAGATLTALPVVGFFLLVQRRIAFGLTAGAVRG